MNHLKSDTGDDGFRRWVLQGFDVQKGEWLANGLNLPDTVGSEIDSTICFEIIDGYFCVLTSQTSFEIQRIEYTSYYDFFRFPLDCPSHEHMERPTKSNLFRRQNTEGPIDDRWTFMKIFSDELSGELKILESRKERLSGNSSATHTYYTKTLRITDTGDSTGSPHGSEGEEDEDQYAENNPLAQFLGTSSKNNKGRPPDRDPSEVHIGDDGSTSIMFPLSKCFIRSYHSASQAFLDLVDDPHESQPCSQRIRIRVGTRLPRPRSKLDTCSTPAGAEDPNQQQMGTACEQSGVVSWPPDAPALENLHDVLNPPGYVGNVHGTWDQRSLVYATGGGTSGNVKALVLVSFDPGICLKGITSFDNWSSANPSKGDLGTRLKDVQTILHPEEGMGKEKREDIIYKRADGLDGEAIVEHKSSASSSGSRLIGRASERSTIAAQIHPHPWASYDTAHYSAIGLGFHFAK